LRFGLGGKAAPDGLVGISCAGGLAIAVVERPRGLRPRLADCTWGAPSQALDARELRNQCQRLRLGRAPCATVMDPQDYQLLLVEAPRVEPSELRAAIRWQVKELIDFHIDDAVLDVFEIPGQGPHAQSQARIMMYAVAARAAAVRQRIELLERCDLRLNVIDIPEMALRNIAALTEEDARGVVMLHLGESSGLITLTRQHNLYLARRIEVGAAALRAAAGSGAAGSELASGDPGDTRFDQLIDAIVLEIQRSIDYYDRHFAQPPLAGVLVAPPGPGLEHGLESSLSSRLGLPVRRLDLNELMEVAQPLDASTQAHCLLAVGAALRQEEMAL